MKILIYGLNYYPEPTGTGKYTGEMAEWIKEKGHDVDVIASLPHYPKWEIADEYKNKGFHTEIVNQVRVFRTPLIVPDSTKLNAKSRVLLESSFAFNSLKYWIPILFKKKKYDLVIVVSPPMQLGLLPLVYKYFRGVPNIFHIQDLQVDAAVRLGMLGDGLFGKILYKIESVLLKKSTIVSTITEAMRKRIVEKKVISTKTWLFPNWSDTNFIKPMNKNNIYRKKFNFTENDIVFMYAGNMGEKQGLELILEAAEILKRSNNIKFVLAGAGGACEKLKKIKTQKELNNVFFLDVQPLEKLPVLISTADVHLIVQKREAADLVMPSKLTNILSSGRPCIGTAEKGTALYEVLKTNNVGETSPPEDLQKFVEMITKMANDNDLRNKMSVNARNYAEQYLNKNQILSSFESKLKELLYNS
ncbi:WcaI family glycosyltransferase [Bacillus sp. Cs-700]|uniref:WcaI family glycosyltransferase n=1 Tax=Bacillus sp. Cs-700 TaxID=2589818 RepID=UPI00140C1C4C|nr:WcaI family glycosyltransferase [Bacillus sp. Cs-700]